METVLCTERYHGNSEEGYDEDDGDHCVCWSLKLPRSKQTQIAGEATYAGSPLLTTQALEAQVALLRLAALTALQLSEALVALREVPGQTKTWEDIV